MRKIIPLLMCLTLLACVLTGCAASAEQHTGEAQGYGGVLRVAVSMNGTDITSVKVVSHSETEGVGTRAIDALPGRIVEADSVQVDGVSGATVTSEAIKAAVSRAIGSQTLPDTLDMSGVTTAEQPAATPAMTGVGMASTGRLGPGEGTTSFNVVFACAGFDTQGRILSLDVEQLEVLSSQFDGFPAEGEGTEDFLAQVSQWVPKGAQGEDYMLGSGSWRQQMDAYEAMMTGMTIDEINAWFGRNFDPATGKPASNVGSISSSGSANTSDSVSGPADADVSIASTDGSNTPADNSIMQAEAITGATMSLRDEHGDILLAIQRAWEDAQRRQNSTPLNTPEGTLTDTNTEGNSDNSAA